MEFIQTELPEVIIVKPTIFTDHRGFFMESYHIDKYTKGGISCKFVQDNHAKSVKNSLRGLHFQLNHPQGKLLRCLQGRIFDVAVDIRDDSSNYGKWVGVELSCKNKYQLFIPPGFAHGYCVLSQTAEIAYKCSEIYHPEDDRGIIWNDPEVDIKWPIVNPILSDKDKSLPLLSHLKKDTLI